MFVFGIRQILGGVGNFREFLLLGVLDCCIWCLVSCLLRAVVVDFVFRFAICLFFCFVGLSVVVFGVDIRRALVKFDVLLAFPVLGAVS